MKSKENDCADTMIYIGCSGYYYKDWVGGFYPPGTQSGNFLNYYAQRFSFTELNFTYYKIPDLTQLQKMQNTVPANFLFTIKAHQELTHIRCEKWEDTAQLFRAALDTLMQTRQLAAILFQFPYSFHYEKHTRRYLSQLLDFFYAFPCAVEFRNVEWYKDSVFRELEKRQIAFVNTDSPELQGLAPRTSLVCSNTALLRLHGRNKEAWWTGNNVSRYDYLYTESELTQIAEVCKILSRNAKQVFVSFNNHYKGKAVKNALSLKRQLQEFSPHVL